MSTELTWKFQMSQQIEIKVGEEKYIQSDQPAWKPGGASATQQSRTVPAFTVLLLLARCKMHYWWLVTWLDAFLLIENLFKRS
jgi:hypothetical protein